MIGNVAEKSRKPQILLMTNKEKIENEYKINHSFDEENKLPATRKNVNVHQSQMVDTSTSLTPKVDTRRNSEIYLDNTFYNGNSEYLSPINLELKNKKS